MPHVDEGTLHALLDGELGAAEVLEVQTHFATCSACAARLDEARQMLAETERLVAALEPPSGNAARAPRFVAGRPMIPLDPVVLIPDNPTPTEVRRSRFKIMAWAASFLVIVGAGFLGLEVRNGLQSNHKSGKLRIRPEEFTFAHDKNADSAAPAAGAAPANRQDSGTTAAAKSPVKPDTAVTLDEKKGVPANSPLALSRSPNPAADNAASTPTPAPQPSSQSAPGKTPPQSAAKVAGPVAIGKAAAPPSGKAAPAPPAAQKAAPAPAANPRDDAAAERPTGSQQTDELKAADDQATPSRNGGAEDRTAAVDRSGADKATADLDREQIRQRAAAATAELDREREQQRAAAEVERRQEAAQAAAPRPAVPTADQQARLSRRIGLDEAAHQLGGPLHAIDGMTRQLVGLVSPDLVGSPGTELEFAL